MTTGSGLGRIAGKALSNSQSRKGAFARLLLERKPGKAMAITRTIDEITTYAPKMIVLIRGVWMKLGIIRGIPSGRMDSGP